MVRRDALTDPPAVQSATTQRGKLPMCRSVVGGGPREWRRG